MKYISIVGPTASGKTNFAINLAKKFNCEIINADSRLFYKDFLIGTDKPKKDKYKKGYYVQGVKHHLIDFLDPRKDYSIAVFIRQAKNIIKKLNDNNITPIIIGGSALYTDALIYNYNISGTAANVKLRKDLSAKDIASLLKILKKESPESFKLVDKKNKRRIIRALELSRKGQQISRDKKIMPKDVLVLGVKKDKEDLSKKINKRVDKMIKEGLVPETKRLLKKYPKISSAFSSIGYREVLLFLDNKMTFIEAVERIKINTRHLAKKQMTWYKRDQNIKWVSSIAEAQKEFKDFN